MEVNGGKNNKCWVLLYELIGTCILSCALNISGGRVEALGIALFMIVIAFGPVSGAHVNPAVSLAVFVAEWNCGNICYLLMIWVAQFAGAALGFALAASS